jgi:antitoxin ParD1/3/4
VDSRFRGNDESQSVAECTSFPRKRESTETTRGALPHDFDATLGRRWQTNVCAPREVLKAHVEGQVASGDWGTPSEYIRALIRQDKERRMANLEQELLAAARGARIEIPIAEIRRTGLIRALRERVRRPPEHRS